MPMVSTNLDNLSRIVSKAGRTLSECSVHAWTLSRRRYLPASNVFFRLLAIDEQRRALAYRTVLLGQEFIVARALLRILIGGYFSCNPEEIQFDYGPQGKPALKQTPCVSRAIAFNMSHSGDVVLIAMTAGTDIGVDIERVDSNRASVEAVADSCLNQQEVTVLTGASPEDRMLTLLRYWTHKEAFLKAIGCGLSVPPQHVRVTFLSSKRSVIREAYPSGRPPMFGSDLACKEGYVGVIASPNGNPNLTYFHF